MSKRQTFAVSRPWWQALGLAFVFGLVPVSAEPSKPPSEASPQPPSNQAGTADLDMSGFLDRLMVAESGGRSNARNPRSTAVGPYQFIESTWLDLARRIFATETHAMTPAQILALRTDHGFARRGAEAYTRDNAAILKAQGLDATFPRLRLAFLLGPQGAVRVLKAAPQTRVTALLGPSVASANPFMFGMTADGLIARAARDLAVKPTSTAGVAASDIPAPGGTKTKTASPPRVAVRCNLDRPSCRKWQDLAIARVTISKPPRKVAVARAH